MWTAQPFKPFVRPSVTRHAKFEVLIQVLLTLSLTSGGYISPTKRGRRLVKAMVRRRTGANAAVCRAWPPTRPNRSNAHFETGASASATVQL